MRHPGVSRALPPTSFRSYLVLARRNLREATCFCVDARHGDGCGRRRCLSVLGIDGFPKRTCLPFPFEPDIQVLPRKEVESEISQIVEDAVSTVAGIEELRSISTDGKLDGFC